MADPVPAIVDLSSSGKKKAVTSKGPPPMPVNPDPWLATVERLAPAIGIEGVKEMMTLRREEREYASLCEFNTSMAEAKGDEDFKPIVKRHDVSFGAGKASYKHEGLADIATVVEPILAKYGIFFRFRATSNLNEPVAVTCILSHRNGYSEETTLRAGADTSGGKNSIQAIGSTVTYLQRYTLRCALGLATTRDDDGQASIAKAETERITDKQRDELVAIMKKSGVEEQIIFDHFKVKDLGDLTAEQHGSAMKKCQKKLELSA